MTAIGNLYQLDDANMLVYNKLLEICEYLCLKRKFDRIFKAFDHECTEKNPSWIESLPKAYIYIIIRH